MKTQGAPCRSPLVRRLHQTVEAKEQVEIQAENQTLATDIPKLFSVYDKLSGMTGTADTEAAEFKQTYDFRCGDYPTHKPIQRIDLDDQIFLVKWAISRHHPRNQTHSRETGADFGGDGNH